MSDMTLAAGLMAWGCVSSLYRGRNGRWPCLRWRTLLVAYIEPGLSL